MLAVLLISMPIIGCGRGPVSTRFPQPVPDENTPILVWSTNEIARPYVAFRLHIAVWDDGTVITCGPQDETHRVRSFPLAAAINEDHFRDVSQQIEALADNEIWEELPEMRAMACAGSHAIVVRSGSNHRKAVWLPDSGIFDNDEAAGVAFVLKSLQAIVESVQEAEHFELPIEDIQERIDADPTSAVRLLPCDPLRG